MSINFFDDFVMRTHEYQMIEHPRHQGQIHIADIEDTTSTTFNSVLGLLTCSLDLIKEVKAPLSLAYRTQQGHKQQKRRSWSEG